LLPLAQQGEARKCLYLRDVYFSINPLLDQSGITFCTSLDKIFNTILLGRSHRSLVGGFFFLFSSFKIAGCTPSPATLLRLLLLLLLLLLDDVVASIV